MLRYTIVFAAKWRFYGWESDEFCHVWRPRVTIAKPLLMHFYCELSLKSKRQFQNRLYWRDNYGSKEGEG